MSELPTSEKVCKCTIHQSIVGDGCEVCNPALALECAKDQIAELKQDVARYENGRVILTQMVETLTAERDQYKQMAEINANTIKCMQAAVTLHANRIDDLFGVVKQS